jgi:hypothetical protein
MQIADVLVTPSMAKDLLSRNKSNRPLRDRLVSLYARDMTQGQWQMNGETVKISKDDELLDGQHRLHAIIKSGKSIRMPVVRNLGKETFHTIDTGMRRSNAQILQIAGFENTTAMASAARFIFLQQISSSERVGMQKNAVTSQEIIDIIKAHPLLHRFMAKYVAGKRGEAGLRKFLLSAAVGVFTLFAEKYGESIVELFIDQLISGEGLKKRDPVFELRERMISNRGAVAKLDHIAQMALLIKSLDAFIHNKTVNFLRWNPKKEPFPSI